MARNLTIGATTITAGSTTGGLSGFTHSIASIAKSVNEIWRFEGAITATADVYTRAQIPNMGDPTFYFIQNHAANAMTITLIHAGGDSPDVLTLAAGGILMMNCATQDALTSIEVFGTNSDEYTMILAD